MTATTNYSSWEFYNNRVQQEAKGGQFVSAETTLIAAGAPTLSSEGTGYSDGEVYPIGLLESFGLQQNKQLQRIFEIGSSRSYFIPGRVIGSISLGRTFYYGPSLLRVLYAYYKNTANGINVGTKAATSTINTGAYNEALDPQARLLSAEPAGGMHQLKRNPGHDYFFVDLASDLFSQPTGMAVYFKDYNNETVGGFYLQECYVQGHQMTISSGSVLVMEGAQLQYDTLVPIKMVTGENA
jgi:hypothetical protein